MWSNEVNQQPTDRLIPFKEVSRITGIKTRNTIKAKVDRGDFPKPVYLSIKCVRWSEREIMEYVDQLPRSFEDCQQQHDNQPEAKLPPGTASQAA